MNTSYLDGELLILVLDIFMKLKYEFNSDS